MPLTTRPRHRRHRRPHRPRQDRARRALTGIDTDRLPEEQERGISIDLGLRALDAPTGAASASSTCPGHERS
jgi:translation initiation factor 2 gamma subunit (eIF-2gamma)